MIHIEKYFDEDDRKALYDLLVQKKQDNIPILEHLIQHKHKHSFRPDFYGDDAIKMKLLAFFEGKCAYCEDFMGDEKIDDKPKWDWLIEHYRPKAGVTEDKKHKGYYWLGYECTNFLVSCTICNSKKNKGNHFPIQKNATRLKDTDFIQNNSLNTQLCNVENPIFRQEMPLLLNPVVDEPSEFIEFCADGTIRGKHNRGTTSIKIYALDRQQLNIRRKAIVDRIRDSIALATIYAQNISNHFFINIINHHLIRLIADIDNPKSTFIAFRRTVLAKFDTFIITNQNNIQSKEPFIMPYQTELLNAYWEIVDK